MKKLLLLAMLAVAGFAATPAFALADHIQVANNTPNQVRAVNAFFVNGKGGSYSFGHL